MDKGLMKYLSLLAFVACIDTLHAQEQLQIVHDSLVQTVSEQISNEAVEINAQIITQAKESLKKPHAWRSAVVLPSVSIYNKKEKIKSFLSRYQDDASIMRKINGALFSDPQDVLNRINNERKGIVHEEFESLSNGFELNGFANSPFNPVNWKGSTFDNSLVSQNLPTTLQTSSSQRIQKLNRVQDVIHDLQNPSGLMESFKKEAFQIKRVYSEKMLKRIYDSLGTKKLDSLATVASKLSKQEIREDELIEAITNSFPEYTSQQPIDTSQLFSSAKGELRKTLSEFQQQDLTMLKLSDSIVHSLPSIRADQIDSRYLKKLDSIRSRMKAERISLEEKPITENIKASIIKPKPKFSDHLYFDGIIGVFEDGKGTILKVSPSLGYNISGFLSIGLGPTVMLKRENQQWNGQVGLRSFLKGELWKQRMYLQLEDNIDPVEVNGESFSNAAHSILFGGGGLLPISKTLAINPSLLYRLNNNETQYSNGSPWVLRIGISSQTKRAK